MSETNMDAFDETQGTCLPANSLPEGWEWVQWWDGSGHLRSPDGKNYFGYDMSPYSMQGGIEYNRMDARQYDVFWGSFDEFKAYAESIVAKTIEFSKTEQSVSSDAERVSSKANEIKDAADAAQIKPQLSLDDWSKEIERARENAKRGDIGNNVKHQKPKSNDMLR